MGDPADYEGADGGGLALYESKARDPLPGETPDHPLNEQVVTQTERGLINNLGLTPQSIVGWLKNRGYEAVHRGGDEYSVRAPGGPWGVVDPAGAMDWYKDVTLDAGDEYGKMWAATKGGTLGAFLGSGAGPIGTVAGAGLGAGAAGAAAEAVRRGAGRAAGFDESLGEFGKGVGWGAVEGVTQELGGRALHGLGKGIMGEGQMDVMARHGDELAQEMLRSKLMPSAARGAAEPLLDSAAGAAATKAGEAVADPWKAAYERALGKEAMPVATPEEIARAPAPEPTVTPPTQAPGRLPMGELAIGAQERLAAREAAQRAALKEQALRALDAERLGPQEKLEIAQAIERVAPKPVAAEPIPGEMPHAEKVKRAEALSEGRRYTEADIETPGTRPTTLSGEQERIANEAAHPGLPQGDPAAVRGFLEGFEPEDEIHIWASRKTATTKGKLAEGAVAKGEAGNLEQTIRRFRLSNQINRPQKTAAQIAEQYSPLSDAQLRGILDDKLEVLGRRTWKDTIYGRGEGTPKAPSELSRAELLRAMETTDPAYQVQRDPAVKRTPGKKAPAEPYLNLRVWDLDAAAKNVNAYKDLSLEGIHQVHSKGKAYQFGPAGTPHAGLPVEFDLPIQRGPAATPLAKQPEEIILRGEIRAAAEKPPKTPPTVGPQNPNKPPSKPLPGLAPDTTAAPAMPATPAPPLPGGRTRAQDALRAYLLRGEPLPAEHAAQAPQQAAPLAPGAYAQAGQARNAIPPQTDPAILAQMAEGRAGLQSALTANQRYMNPGRVQIMQYLAGKALGKAASVGERLTTPGEKAIHVGRGLLSMNLPGTPLVRGATELGGLAGLAMGGLRGSGAGALAGYGIGHAAQLPIRGASRAAGSLSKHLMRLSGTEWAAIAKAGPPPVRRLAVALLQRAQHGGPAALRAGAFLVAQDPEFQEWVSSIGSSKYQQAQR